MYCWRQARQKEANVNTFSFCLGFTSVLVMLVYFRSISGGGGGGRRVTASVYDCITVVIVVIIASAQEISRRINRLVNHLTRVILMYPKRHLRYLWCLPLFQTCRPWRVLPLACHGGFDSIAICSDDTILS